jgi:hypothetical protein
LSLPGLCFVFLLLGQNGFHHVAGLGDVGEIDLGCDCLRTACTGARTCVIARARAKLGTHFLSFILLERAGVGFARSQAQLRQYVKNLAALDF